jgi:hypothetical protein
METKKALLIKGETDADLILDDGSYAFFWLVDGIVKCDLHQGRIERKLLVDDEIGEVANEKCDKMYFQEWNQFTLENTMLNEAIEWLCVGKSLSDFTVKTIDAKTCDFNEEVNTFLNLK